LVLAVIAAVVVAAVIVAVLAGAGPLGATGHPPGDLASPATAPAGRATAPAATPQLGHRSDERLDGDRSRGGRAALSAADGEVPPRTTVFDDHDPAITRLDPHLLAALRAAATDAAASGITFSVNSGWRSQAYQEQLFEEAVVRYGSPAAAERWVARPGTSVHEAGDAVDIGGSGATAWLSRYGRAYGLCQIYGNESWHYELRPEAIAGECPAMYDDPTDDPRMHR
jgi:hypothetical protein